MRTNIFYTIAGCGALIAMVSSCSKEQAPDTKLNIQLDKVEYVVGDVVTFKLIGNPDNIVFYSGEIGHNYANKDREHADNDLNVEFKSFVRYPPIFQNLSFMVSNDFSGVYDKESVEAATWSDASEKFTFSSAADQTPSGMVNLKEYAGDKRDAQLYLAFRNRADDTQKNQWIIRSITADIVSPEGVETNVGAMASMGWVNVDLSTAAAAVWTISTAQLLSPNKGERDSWVISKAFKMKEAIPDTGVVIKNISKQVTEYQHTYTKAGTYKVIFDTSSVWYNSSKQSLTEVIVEVKEAATEPTDN